MEIRPEDRGGKPAKMTVGLADIQRVTPAVVYWNRKQVEKHYALDGITKLVPVD